MAHMCHGQILVIDSCGVNSNPSLNKFEAQYFNQTCQKQRNGSCFDFSNKTIGFAFGNFGNELVTKAEYFERWGKDYYKRNSDVVNQLIVLTDEEKKHSGGYDAIVVSWSKFVISQRSKEKLIKKLKRSRSMFDN